MPAAKVLPAVPDVKTVKKDWMPAGVTFTDAARRRIEVHAFRHTFLTKLDRTGCLRATRKKLKRHAAEDVTDGYGHAELDEMLAALKRLPAPDAPQQQTATKSGTDNQPVTGGGADHLLDQNSCAEVQTGLHANKVMAAAVATSHRHAKRESPRKSQAKCASVQADAGPCLIGAGSSDIVADTGPSTQVD